MESINNVLEKNIFLNEELLKEELLKFEGIENV